MAWKICKNGGGRNYGKIKLDITGDKPWDHYSFIARSHNSTSKGPAIRIDWVWEYFDKGDYFFIPDTPQATAADVFSYSEHAAEQGRQALAAAGIDDTVLPQFLDAVKNTGGAR